MNINIQKNKSINNYPSSIEHQNKYAKLINNKYYKVYIDIKSEYANSKKLQDNLFEIRIKIPENSIYCSTFNEKLYCNNITKLSILSFIKYWQNSLYLKNENCNYECAFIDYYKENKRFVSSIKIKNINKGYLKNELIFIVSLNVNNKDLDKHIPLLMNCFNINFSIKVNNISQ